MVKVTTPPASTKKTTTTPKSSKDSGTATKPEKRGWDEIESLFHDKKKEKTIKAAEAKKEDQKHSSKKRPRTSGKSFEDEANSGDVVIPKPGEWVNDGLGGKYDAEGFTGRVEDGVKIFKAHVLRRPNAGQTDLCPFDCDCCFI